MHRLFPFLRWLPEVRQPGVLRRDLIAGITVAAVVIPQALAYARLAGLPAVYGLYAALIPPVVAALWGSCRQLVTGPMATASLISAATVAALAPPETEAFISFSILLGLLVGVLRVSVGLLRLGVLVNLLSAPVVTGFANAAALIIASSQLQDVLGVRGTQHDFYLQTVWSILRQLPAADLPTVGVGLLTAAVLVALRRHTGKILIAVVISTVVAWASGFHGAVVGTIAPGLPSFQLPHIDWQALPALFIGAVVLTVIGFTETMSIAKVIATRTRQSVDPNQELIGQGLANIVGSFFQSFSVSGSFARSAVNLQSGAATGLSMLVTSLVILATLLLFTPLFHYLPQATLATIIIISVLGLFRLEPIRQAWQVSQSDGAIGLVTFAVTLALAPQLQWGIAVGVGLSVAQYLRHTMRPHVAYLARHPDGALVDAEAHGLALDTRIALIRFDGRLYFGAASFFEDKVLEALARMPDLRHVVLDAGGINEIDATGVQTLRRVGQDLQGIGVDVHVTRVKDRVYQLLETTGLASLIGEDHFHDWNQHALDALWEKMEPVYRAHSPLNVATSAATSGVWSI